MTADDLLKSMGFIVMECPQCGNKIVTSCWFGSGAYYCSKCSPDEIIRYDYVSEEAKRKNQEENYDMLIEFIKENYPLYLSDKFLDFGDDDYDIGN